MNYNAIIMEAKRERKKPIGGIGDALMAIANVFFPSPDSLKRGR